jgi:hypothetical protein
MGSAESRHPQWLSRPKGHNRTPIVDTRVGYQTQIPSIVIQISRSQRTRHFDCNSIPLSPCTSSKRLRASSACHKGPLTGALRLFRRTRNDEAKAQVCEDMRAQALARAQPTHHLDD